MLNQELYIFHRAGLIKEFEVRSAEKKDFSGVEHLVHNINSKTQMLEDLNMYLKSRKADVTVFLNFYFINNFFFFIFKSMELIYKHL